MGQQFQQGFADIGKAVSADVVKGLSQVTKDVARSSVENLTGVSLTPQSQIQKPNENQGEEERKMAEMKVKNDQARRNRLNQVRQEIEELYKRREQEKQQQQQMVVKQEEEKEKKEEQKDSAKKVRLSNFLRKATKGTGEMAKNKN